MIDRCSYSIQWAAAGKAPPLVAPQLPEGDEQQPHLVKPSGQTMRPNPVVILLKLDGQIVRPNLVVKLQGSGQTTRSAKRSPTVRPMNVAETQRSDHLQCPDPICLGPAI